MCKQIRWESGDLTNNKGMRIANFKKERSTRVA